MSDIKMSETFPEAFQVEHNKSFEVQDATWYSYGEKYESDGDQDSAIEHAVLNHDRLIEESKQQRESLDAFKDLVKAQTKMLHDLNEENKHLKSDRDSAISLMSKSWQHNAEDHPTLLTRFVKMANRQFESLGKQKKENAELREFLESLQLDVSNEIKLERLLNKND